MSGRSRLFSWPGWKIVLSESVIEHITLESAQHVIVLERKEPATSPISPHIQWPSGVSLFVCMCMRDCMCVSLCV